MIKYKDVFKTRTRNTCANETIILLIKTVQKECERSNQMCQSRFAVTFECSKTQLRLAGTISLFCDVIKHSTVWLVC